MSGEEFRALAEEQGALRRVATLVARGAPPDKVFAAVTEVGRVLGAEMTNLCRYDPDGAITVLGSVEGRWQWPIGSRWPLGGKNVATARVRDRPSGSYGQLGC